MRRPFALVLILSVGALGGRRPAVSVERIGSNDNRKPAGTLAAGVLTVRLEARPGSWHPDGDNSPGAEMPAFAEVGRTAQIPGPMIRAIAGTRVSATVSNALPNDTLLVHGLYARERGGKAGPPIELLPGQSRTVEFVLGEPGTYYYWGTTMRRPLRYRTREDSQLTGAIVVDAPGAPTNDRVFILGIWSDTVGGRALACH